MEINICVLDCEVTESNMTQGILRNHATFWRGCRLAGDNVTSEMFRQSWLGRFSPLWWRVPILMWSVAITAWSAAGFWGPPGKYFVYMTHWGLMLIVAESLVGILVTLKKPYEKDLGKLCEFTRILNTLLCRR